MSAFDGKRGGRFRPSAVIPFALSSIAFVLTLLLVLSGTRPDLIQDGYLLSLNTTNIGQNLIQFNHIAATPTGNAIRDISSADSLGTLSSGSTSSQPTLNLPAPRLPNISGSTSSLVSAATLTVPAVTTSTPSSTATSTPSKSTLSIGVLETFFQVVLNSLASGVGDTLKAVIALLVTTSKTQLGVPQYYTLHLFNICEGSSANATDPGNPFNITRCPTYSNASTVIANLSSSVSSSMVIGATNVTIPLLSKVPSLGKSAKTLIDASSTTIFASFIFSLVGSGSSILLSTAAFFLPSYPNLYISGAVITTTSTSVLLTTAITVTVLVSAISSSINGFSDTLGLRAGVGPKFFAFMWVSFVVAQMANWYWLAVWFVEFRQRSYKARGRTRREMGDYKGIGREVLSDFRLQVVGDEDTEVLAKMREGVGLRYRVRSNYNQI